MEFLIDPRKFRVVDLNPTWEYFGGNTHQRVLIIGERVEADVIVEMARKERIAVEATCG